MRLKTRHYFFLYISILLAIRIFGKKNTDTDASSESLGYHHHRSETFPHANRLPLNNIGNNRNTRNPFLRGKEAKKGIAAHAYKSETIKRMNDHRITKSVLSNIFQHSADLDGLDDDEVEMMINEDDHSNYSPFEDNMLYILSLYVVQYALILTLINPIFSIIVMLRGSLS